MPAKMTKQLNGKYMVSTPNKVHGRDMTKKNAEKQRNLLNAIEHSDWKPTGEKTK